MLHPSLKKVAEGNSSTVIANAVCHTG